MSNSLSLFKFKGNVSLDDVLTIVTSRAEEEYTRHLRLARETVKEAEAALNKELKEVAKLADSEVKAAEADKVEALRKAVTNLGGKITIRPNHSWNEHAHQLSLDDNGNLSAHVSIGNSYGNQFTVRVKPSELLMAKVGAVSAAKQAVKDAQEVALGWKKKLSGIGQLERKCKAKIAKAKLSESDDGQQILELLETDLDKTIANLEVA